MMVCIDSQGVLLLNGQAANVELEYDEVRDVFVVTADCEDWADDYRRFTAEYYPEDKDAAEETIKDAEADCKEISGTYFTLREINNRLDRLCNPGDWYEFTWEYEDGTEVE